MLTDTTDIATQDDAPKTICTGQKKRQNKGDSGETEGQETAR
jgi:hypothetical protein